jgi:transposase InsO family protein
VKTLCFLQKNIFSIFGVPREITIDQGPQFTSNLIERIMKQHNIHHMKYSPYHPQANGKLEVTNMELENILTKTIIMHKKDWENKLIEAIWAYNTWKTTIGSHPMRWSMERK